MDFILIKLDARYAAAKAELDYYGDLLSDTPLGQMSESEYLELTDMIHNQRRIAHEALREITLYRERSQQPNQQPGVNEED